MDIVFEDLSPEQVERLKKDTRLLIPGVKN